jgi:hypothetical protein
LCDGRWGVIVEEAAAARRAALLLLKINFMKKVLLLLLGLPTFAFAQTRTRDFFDKKGRHLFTIAYYDEKGLPAEVRAIVKPVYYDYAIKSVEEIRLVDRKIYLIDMQDSTQVKTVRVADGEMEVVRELVRGDRVLEPKHGF